MRGSLGCAALGLHCSWRGRGWVGFPGLSLPASGLWGNVVAAFLPLLKLTPIEELFLFLMYLSVGLKQRDLGHRFFIHRTTVSRIIITWANFFTPFTGLYTLLGSMCIWMPPEVIKAHLPKEFSSYQNGPLVKKWASDGGKMVCTSQFLFSNIEVKWPGSVHDSRIFHASSLAQRFAKTLQQMQRGGSIMHIQRQGHALRWHLDS
ncbi:uncharacterized protein LOC143493455 isoform X2 [Brachyhypopomus gauderio]|uniref:uncharacterized protein LOC143493455 isoform X2 n=1 Tax=Brachyhypopomus gauderio TaxID=698409 RepID=UPI00404309B3